MFAASKSGSADAKDAQFKNVTMLLHGNGTNGAQNNTFLDSSTNNFTITRNGNTTQGTFTPYGSNWSNYFDGTGDYLSLASNAAFTVGTGAVTIEAWIYCTSLSQAYQGILSGRLLSNPEYPGLGLVIDANKVQFTIFNQSTGLTDSATVPLNQWVHVAGVRSGTNAALFVNGVRKASSTSNSDNGTSSAMVLGRYYPADNNYYFSGYISNARIVKGTAVYDPTQTTLSVPTAPLTAVSGTSLLTCQGNRFLDASTNNFAVTGNGNTSVQRFSPFSPTTAYSTSVIGGSGYFDGSGDYLRTATGVGLLGANDFSIEAWVYPTSAISSVTLASGQSDLATIAGSSWTFNLGSSSAAALYVGSGGDFGITSASPVVNAWNHVVFCRTGGTISTYLNGSRVATRTDLGTSSVNNGSTSNAPSIGANPAGNVAFPGYIAGHQRIIGSGGFSATGTTITVPTAPPTVLANTNLLLNFTNAAIFDNAMMNNLETVGNAQISTSVKKYGTGSIYMDGSGDWVSASSSPNYGYGTGDFTIEFWVYPTSSAGIQVLLDQRTGTSTRVAPTIYTSASVVYYYVNGNNRISGTSPSLNQWSHFAISRSGTSTKMFINGTQIGSTYTDTFDYVASPVRIGDGNDGAGPYPYSGYIDDLRITKGVARYTANFSVPNAAFPNN